MKKCFAILLAAAMLLCAAPLAGFTAIDWPEIDFNGLFLSAKAAEIVDSGTCGEVDEEKGLDGSQLKWELDSDGVLTVSGKGKMNGGYMSGAFCHLGKSVQTAVIKDGVESIGVWAFHSCVELKKVTIASSVTSIDSCAFSHCTGLTEVTLPDSITILDDYAFSRCENLEKITLPANLNTIERDAFAGCSSLREITIPDKVSYIGSGAFSDCSGLTTIHIPASVTSIYSAFSGCTGLKKLTVDESNPKYSSKGNCLIDKETKTLVVGFNNSVIPSDGSVTVIGWWAFHDCTEMESVDIPSGIVSVGYHAFDGCTGLKKISFSDTVAELGSDVFDGCSAIEKIEVSPDNPTFSGAGNCLIKKESKTIVLGCKNSVIPNDGSVTAIGFYAFHECIGLIQIEIPDCVSSIEAGAFDGCAGLTGITIPKGVTVLSSGIFQKCTGLKEVKLPETLWKIDTAAFNYCENLQSITIPNGVTDIERGAFSGCKSLPSVTLPDSLISIGDNAFFDCEGITSIVIPPNVNSLGYDYSPFSTPTDRNPFRGCNNLISLVVAEGNEKYHSENNCIIETASKTLIAGCKTSIIPDDGSVTIINDGAFNSCEGLRSITIPEGVTAIGNNAFSNCQNLVSIVIPVSVTRIDSFAVMRPTFILGRPDSYAQQWAEENNVDFAVFGDATVTLQAPPFVADPIVNVYGLATIGSIVVCSVDEKESVSVPAAFNSRWNAEIPLTGAKDGDSFTIKATVTVDGKTAEKTATVTYKPDAVVFQELTLNHNRYSMSLHAENMGVSKPNITYIPGNPLSFKIKVSNSDRVDKLYVVSTKEETSKRMELTYNEATGCWFADGFFDAADKNYVPGVLTITGVDKDGKDFDAGATIKINFLIDPSGYAYEGVLSNKLEGVTAAVYYKDEAGHELLWNAETADQLNPVTTLSDGAFAWVVPEGEWQVRLTKPGYLEARSAWMEVPPEYTDVYIAMAASAAPEVAYCNIYADRAEITFSQYMDVDTVNADNVTFTGYTGAVKPLDAEELGEGSGIWYAKTFSFTPDKAFAGEINVKIENAANYVGTALTAPYTATFTVAAEPKNLTAAQDVTVKYGETAEIAVSAENAAGKTVTVACDSANVTLSATTLTLDETGKATLSVTGDMPGTANLTFSLDGATMKATSTVTVAISEKPTEPAYTPGDVDGNGKIESADARLALRASVKLETYAEGSAKFLAADYDKNGKIESADARAILRVSVKLDPFG